MVTIRCTRKLYKSLEITPLEIPEPPTGALGDWYANLIPTYAGDLIMFVNERSLLTVAIPVWEVENLIPLFRVRVKNLLFMIGIEWEVIRISTENINKKITKLYPAIKALKNDRKKKRALNKDLLPKGYSYNAT